MPQSTGVWRAELGDKEWHQARGGDTLWCGVGCPAGAQQSISLALGRGWELNCWDWQTGAARRARPESQGGQELVWSAPQGGFQCVHKDIQGGLISYTNLILRENTNGWNISTSLNFTALQPKFPGLVHLPSFLAKWLMESCWSSVCGNNLSSATFWGCCYKVGPHRTPSNHRISSGVLLTWKARDSHCRHLLVCFLETLQGCPWDNWAFHWPDTQITH